MLRTWYSFLLRLHPAPFRREYERQMLAIFDEVAASGNVFELFTDAAVSLFRQWVLRPRNEPVPAASGDVPVLASLDSYTPRPEAMLLGCLLSIASFFAVVAVSIHPGRAPSWLIGIHRATESLLPVSRSSLTGVDPDTLVRLGERPKNPLPSAASQYFKFILVLGALDADGDLIISPQEIAAAPSVLRRLDVNHDGKLSPEECGFSTGDKTKSLPAQKQFMVANPVLAALDADHNGEISAKEIRDSSQHLRTLDRDGDGSLTPNEVMPSRPF